MKNEQDKRYWQKASAAWTTFAAPLCPCCHVLEIIDRAVCDWRNRFGDPRVLMLGVTPEYFHYWPEGTDLLAVDKCETMIETVWPGPVDAASCQNWLNMDLPDASRDIVLSDGGFPLLIPPRDQAQLVENLSRITADSGRVIIRSFVTPSRAETFEQVLEDLFAGRIGNVHVLKMRLWLSLADDPQQGIDVADIWHALIRAVPDLDALSEKLGWRPEGLRQMKAYGDSADRYYFLSETEITRYFCQDVGGFRHLGTHYPSYELGERCPVLVFERI